MRDKITWGENIMRILHVLSSDDQYGSALCFLELLQCELKYKNIVFFAILSFPDIKVKFCFYL